MAKVLADDELGMIVMNAVRDNSIIDCADAYEHFLEDLADLICNHFGGTRGSTTQPDCNIPVWTVAIHVDENVPEDGGIYKDFDTDVTWKNGIEE